MSVRRTRPRWCGTLVVVACCFAALTLPAQAAGKLAAPALAKSANVRKVSGKVFLKTRGSHRFVTLDGSAHIQLGATIDATNGRVTVTTASPPGTRPTTQSMDFYQGRFVLTQDTTGLATATLSGGNFSKCGSSSLARTARSRTVRKLWGKGRGRYRTRGRYGAATVRGTQWLTEDTCTGTRVSVVQGLVEVTDLLTGQSVLVGPGQSYTVPRGSASSFQIRGMLVPTFIVANQPGKEHDIFYSGQPTFPLTLVSDPVSCPARLNCGHPRVQVNGPGSPLRFPGFWNCTGTIPPGTVFDYQFTLVDARGVRTNTVTAAVPCHSH